MLLPLLYPVKQTIWIGATTFVTRIQSNRPPSARTKSTVTHRFYHIPDWHLFCASHIYSQYITVLYCHNVCIHQKYTCSWYVESYKILIDHNNTPPPALWTACDPSFNLISQGHWTWCRQHLCLNRRFKVAGPNWQIHLWFLLVHIDTWYNNYIPYAIILSHFYSTDLHYSLLPIRKFECLLLFTPDFAQFIYHTYAHIYCDNNQFEPMKMKAKIYWLKLLN